MSPKIDQVEVFGATMPLVMEFINTCLSNSVVNSALLRVTVTGGAAGFGNLR